MNRADEHAGWTARRTHAALSRLTLRNEVVLRARQRSYCCCMLSQLSGVVPNATDNLRAIAGLTPERPLRSSESALRVAPSALAAYVTVMPSGARQATRTILPTGVGGRVCIRRVPQREGAAA